MWNFDVKRGFLPITFMFIFVSNVMIWYDYDAGNHIELINATPNVSFKIEIS